jgi:ferredoxin--NADP+ reductase
MNIEVPRVAKSALPGQFVIVRAHEKGERIPLTICDYDAQRGTVALVIQVVGASSRKICQLNEGDHIPDLAGPLGRPSEFVHLSTEAWRKKRILFVAGGLGTAPVYPQVKWLHEKGVAADVIMGAKNESLLILQDEMKRVAGNLYIATDDGSAGFKGLVTDLMKKLISEGRQYDEVIAIGPMIMMKFVTHTAQSFDIPVTVSLNTLMVDGTGMCGACRVSVGGKIKFACVDGPEFDGALVNFEEAMRRQTMYKPKELEADHQCRLEIQAAAMKKQ